MSWERRAFLPLLLVLVLTPFVSALACEIQPDPEVRRDVGAIAAPYAFQLFGWEAAALVKRLGPAPAAPPGAPEEAVLDYFRLVREKSALLARQDGNDSDGRAAAIERELNRLSPFVGTTIERQLHDALLALDITNPFPSLDRTGLVFPPVALRLERPPRLLVISPRERIVYLQRITLRPDLTSEERARVEADCDRLGVSSLVEDLGGLATYPSIVSGDTNLSFVLETAAEEWTHQYLTFRPLGFRYALDITGVKRDPEIITLNETLAGIVSGELARHVVANRYVPYLGGAPTPTPPKIDFNREMRITRERVDGLLSRGEVTAAEIYMEERRQFFLQNGYYIRKLNQAYFAFHGTYAYHPASVSPVYADLQELRSRSRSLKEFVDRASAMVSNADLRAALGS